MKKTLINTALVIQVLYVFFYGGVLIFQKELAIIPQMILKRSQIKLFYPVYESIGIIVILLLTILFYFLLGKAKNKTSIKTEIWAIVLFSIFLAIFQMTILFKQDILFYSWKGADALTCFSVMSNYLSYIYLASIISQLLFIIYSAESVGVKKRL